MLVRLKDAEWVEKKQDSLKKSLRGATGTANLKDKALKEELVSADKVPVSERMRYTDNRVVARHRTRSPRFSSCSSLERMSARVLGPTRR